MGFIGKECRHPSTLAGPGWVIADVGIYGACRPLRSVWIYLDLSSAPCNRQPRISRGHQAYLAAEVDEAQIDGHHHDRGIDEKRLRDGQQRLTTRRSVFPLSPYTGSHWPSSYIYIYRNQH
jgi:hypothetical protein